MKKIVYLFLIVFVFTGTSCQQQLIGLFKKGNFKSSHEVVEIPFVFENNLMVIQVKIQGKPYRFLLDTGAPNVISTELSAELALRKGRKINTVDSQGNGSALEYVNIPMIDIGGAIFQNTTAGIANLKQTDAIACLNIDGIIGSNLMRKANWQIDCQKQIIRIAVSMELLPKGAHSYVVPFSTEITGTPYFTVKIGPTEMKRLQLDTGSVGFMSTDNETYHDVREKDQILNERASYGINTVGLFGSSSSDTIRQFVVKDLQIGEVKLTNQIIEAKRSNKQLLGMSFLKNYIVSIDWKKQFIVLEPAIPFQNEFAESFGIGLMKQGEKMVVSYLTEGSEAEKSNLKIGDIVVRVNDVDVSTASLEDYCRIIKLVRLKEENLLRLVVLRNGVKDELILKKLPILKPLP